MRRRQRTGRAERDGRYRTFCRAGSTKTFKFDLLENRWGECHVGTARLVGEAFSTFSCSFAICTCVLGVAYLIYGFHALQFS